MTNMMKEFTTKVTDLSDKIDDQMESIEQRYSRLTTETDKLYKKSA